MRPIAATRSAAEPVAIGTAPRSSGFRNLWAPLAVGLALAAAGCADIKPYIPTSEGHIGAPLAKPEPESAIPPPTRVTEFLPPPKPAAKPQTYSVVVNEVPVKDLLLALARDTKQNIDVHPGISGIVSLNAINETLPAILERVSKQVNMRYRLEGNTIIVSPDLPYMKTYRVNYVNMTRDTTSTIGVTGEIATAGGAGAAGGGGTSGSRTTVETKSQNDFWGQLERNMRAILNSTRLQSLSAEARVERLKQERQAEELRIKQLEAVSRAGQAGPAGAAPQLSPSLVASVVSAPSAQIPEDVVVNSVSGTVTVNATERQHQLVQQHLDNIVNAMQRQVLIEATIVEVILNNNYQGGVDWSRLAISGGITFTQALLGGFGTGLSAAGANFFQLGYLNPTSRAGNISATIRLLEEFGNTRVLSSPKLMALNNQTALLKVVDNIVYFEIQAQTTTTQGTSSTTFNTIPKTVAVGVVMGVTPQVSEDGRVSLSVRPTISRVLRFVNDPNPSLANPCGIPVPALGCSIAPINSPVPEVQVREMESVLQVGSGQTVILGGLMQDDVRRNREQVPGADMVDPAGELLRFRDERLRKSELVIFLRPTVVANPSLDSDELRFFQRFLPKPEAPPQQPEKTGAAR